MCWHKQSDNNSVVKQGNNLNIVSNIKYWLLTEEGSVPELRECCFSIILYVCL